MAKKIEIDIEVNSKSVVDAKGNVDGLNKSIQDTGNTTKDFGSNVKIEYDKMGNATDVLVNKELNLKQQVKVLYSELQKLSSAGRENSKDFATLSAKYNDTKDNLDRVNAKSRDFFATLQLIPGPIGQIASQINGAIGLLKTFSGFKLSDVKNQFKELKNDIQDVFLNLGGFEKAKEAIESKYAKPAGSSVNTVTTGGDTANTTLNTGAETANTTATLQNAAAQKISSDEKLLDAKSTAIDTLATDKNTLAQVENSIIVKSLSLEYIKREIATMKAAGATQNDTGEITLHSLAQREDALATKISDLQTEKSVLTNRIATAEKKASTAATEGQTGALTKEAIAAKEAEMASARLAATWKGIASATVIGAIVLGLIKIVSLLKDMWFETEKNNLAFKQFADGLKIGSEALENELRVIQNWNAERTAELKKSNADASALRNQDIESVKKQQEAIRRQIKSTDQDIQNALDTYISFKGTADEGYVVSTYKKMFRQDEAKQAYENYQAALEKQRQLTQKDADLTSQIKVKAIENDTASTQEGYAKQLAELDAKIQLEVMKVDTNGEKLQNLLDQRAQMVIDHEKLWGEKNQAQRDLMAKQNREKVTASLEEDSKRVEEFLNKETDIEINAIKDKQTREERARLQKFNSDVAALAYDTEWKRASLEEKNQIFTNMEIAYEEDLLKIKETYFLKQYQKDQERKDRELKLKQQHNQNLLDEDQQHFMTGEVGFFNEALLQTKKYLENRFTDMKQANVAEHAERDVQLQTELLTLGQAHEQKKLSDEEYANKKIEVNQKISDNDQQLVDKQKQLDKTLLDAKKETAAMTMNIAENLVGVLNALGNFSTDWQITAAIAEAGLGIAKIIISTQVAIAEFSASVAGLGVVGAGMATAYAVKAKINAALGIAAITVGAIGRINQIKGQSSQTASEPDKGNKPNYGDGGMINGPLHAQGGVAITAEGGEAVMTRGAVTAFRPLLSMMNQMGGGTSFSRGAVGQANFDNPSTNNTPMEQPIIKTYVVSNELTTDAHRAARLKDLSTL